MKLMWNQKRRDMEGGVVLQIGPRYRDTPMGGDSGYLEAL